MSIKGTYEDEGSSLRGRDTGHIKARVKGSAVFFIGSKFPVFFIMFTLLPLPFFMDGEGDVAVSASSPLCSFVSDQSHDGNRKRGTLCKQIKLFSESQFGKKDAPQESLRKYRHRVSQIYLL